MESKQLEGAQILEQIEKELEERKNYYFLDNNQAFFIKELSTEELLNYREYFKNKLNFKPEDLITLTDVSYTDNNTFIKDGFVKYDGIKYKSLSEAKDVANYIPFFNVVIYEVSGMLYNYFEIYILPGDSYAHLLKCFLPQFELRNYTMIKAKADASEKDVLSIDTWFKHVITRQPNGLFTIKTYSRR